MKKAITLALLFCLIISCGEEKKVETEDSIDGSEFSFDTTKVAKELSNLIAADTSVVITPSPLADLPYNKTIVKSYNGNTNLGMTVPGFLNTSLGKKESSLHTYFVRAKIVDTPQGQKVACVGYSVNYLFKKVKRSLQGENLAKISASVELDNGKTEVYYSIQSWGMSGYPLIKYFKPVVNKDFDVEGYGIMQSSIDGIHAVMGDPEMEAHINYTPEIISFLSPADLQ